jgi:hypothetical protein
VLTRIGAVEIALGRGAIVRGSNDLFPNEGLEVKDVHVCDHSTFCDKTATLG